MACSCCSVDSSHESTSSFTAALAVTISNTQFVDRTKYRLIFTDAAGVIPGDEVRIAGVSVGQVDSIKLYQGNLAQVTVSVLKSERLPRSTQAQLRYRNLMGQRYVSLTQGSGQGGYLGQNPGGSSDGLQTYTQGYGTDYEPLGQHNHHR